MTESQDAFFAVEHALREAAEEVLRQQLETLVGADLLNFEYLSSRLTKAGRLRGRFKLSIPLAVIQGLQTPAEAAGGLRSAQEDAASYLCKLLEEEWRTLVRAQGFLDAEVALAWQEARIGRWTTLR